MVADVAVVFVSVYIFGSFQEIGVGGKVVCLAVAVVLMSGWDVMLEFRRAIGGGAQRQIGLCLSILGTPKYFLGFFGSQHQYPSNQQ